MTDNHWAVFALRDIKDALDEDHYTVASCHINDAIAAILASCDEEFDLQDHSLSKSVQQRHPI